MRLLILGGTSEASALALALRGRADIAATLSLAGRTAHPAAPPIPCRSGGFGGVAGLGAYLARERIDAVIDATHPFAEQMSRHAELACRAAGVPLAVFTRPGWTPQPGDRWREVESFEAAADAIGAAPRRVFLTQGRLQLAAFARAPQHHYLVRAIDPPEAMAQLPDARLILARGPFALADELELLRRERIETLVSKNSGGAATYAKIEAARELGMAVILIGRGPGGAAETFFALAPVLDWIEAHRPAP